eukprot:1147745-Pelagomonas_calceolata.AAC.5
MACPLYPVTEWPNERAVTVTRIVEGYEHFHFILAARPAAPPMRPTPPFTPPTIPGRMLPPLMPSPRPVQTLMRGLGHLPPPKSSLNLTQPLHAGSPSPGSSANPHSSSSFPPTAAAAASSLSPTPPTALEGLTREAWQGYLRVKGHGHDALHQRLRSLLGHLDLSEQQEAMEEAWA